MFAVSGVLRKAIQKISWLRFVKIACVLLSGMGQLLPHNNAPFGISCAAALFFCGENVYLVLVAAAGIVFSGEPEMLRHLLTLLLLTGASAGNAFFKEERTSGVTAVVCHFIAGLIWYGFVGGTIYFWMTVVAEAAMLFFMIRPFSMLLKALSVGKISAVAQKEQVAEILAAGFVCASALSVVYLPGNIRLMGVVACLALLLFAYSFSYGACAVAGAMAGVVVNFNTENVFSMVGIYTIAALICRSCKSYGKAGVLCGFLLADAVVVFCVGNPFIPLWEIGIAGIVFTLFPAHRLLYMEKRVRKWRGLDEQKEESEVVKQMTVKRLERVADAFSMLAASMHKAGRDRKKEGEQIAHSLAEDVYGRICKGCGGRNRCFQASGAEKALENLLIKTVQRGRSEPYDLQTPLKDLCIQRGKLTEVCNRVFELYRMNRVWENRVLENRRLVSEQMFEVSDIIRDLADEVSVSLKREKEMEKQLILLLENVGVRVERAKIFIGLKGRLHVDIDIAAGREKDTCVAKIEAALYKATGKNFKLKCRRMNKEHMEYICIERETYAVQIGIARERPKREQVCGDSYAVMYPEDGKLIVALSDGMGIGADAAKESKEAIGLLEQLLMAGISRETAVKLMNSVLVLKSYNESFATLDLFVLDLYTGEGELIKNAGACSYVCRGDKVGVITAQMLPAGVLREMDTISRRMIFRPGDRILLVSDGVTDVCDNDTWIKSFLLGPEKNSVQVDAESLLREAKKYISVCKDDMTVILLEISEK